MMVLDAAISGDDQRWPPGFRFHPTDEELVLYYLKRKICRRRLKLDIIGETDVYKWDPEELPGLSKLKTGDRLWFFFSHRDRKYPNGARSNRATRKGYWKATGKDRQISCNSRSVGVKKTLVFYKGRAPTGERTDWVMHEYTLDEEELQRCPMVKDYYALYKLFKKSGPGPKNGEQYGAPFREEEWVDDDNLNTENPAVPEVSLKLIDAISPVNTCKAKAQVESPLVDDLEEFMNRIADDPVVIQPLAVNYDQVLHELIGEEETEFIFDNQSLTEANLCEQSVVLHPSSQHNCFGPTQSTTSHMQNNDISDVTSDLSCYQQKTQVEDDLFEDFLEMDDLLDSEPSCQNVGKPSMNFEDLDGLSEFDLFQDANMFLQGDGSINAEHLPELYYTNNQNEMVPPTLGGSSNNFAHEVLNAVSESYYGNAGPLIYQLQNHASDANGVINNQFWVPDQNCNNFSAANELNQQAFTSQSSGVVHDGISSNFYAGVNQIQNQNPSQNEIGDGESGGDSWLSSALWAFVESIPSNPASASETNALVNKAFERVSSFRRLRIGVADANSAAAGNTAANKRRCGGSNNYRRLYIFSVVGVVCAALWMFNC